MATVSKIRGGKGLHIEAKGCIVNITEGLPDRKGRSVTSIQIIPDKYAGEPVFKVVPMVHNVRVIKLLTKKN
jgi:hypothetical protein